MALPEHSKIINKVARQILKPEGLERKGQSRTWLDDNGWFTTVVEFQPFKDRKGTCINIGVNFHWYVQDYWSFDIGYRESDFIDFRDENQFTLEIENLTKTALNKVLDYKQNLKELKHSKETILEHEFTSENLWGSYHKGIICGLIGDNKKTNFYFNRLLDLELKAPFEKELEKIVIDLKEKSLDINLFKDTVLVFIKESRRQKRLSDIEIEIK